MNSSCFIGESTIGIVSSFIILTSPTLKLLLPRSQTIITYYPITLHVYVADPELFWRLAGKSYNWQDFAMAGVGGFPSGECHIPKAHWVCLKIKNPQTDNHHCSHYNFGVYITHFVCQPPNGKPASCESVFLSHFFEVIPNGATRIE